MRRFNPAAAAVCAAVLLVLAGPCPAAAAQGRATLNGVVTGPSGAPEANITLIITNAGGVDRRAVTDVSGAFVFGGLQPGTYRLRTDNDTFAPFSQEGIVLAGGQVLPMKIALLPRLPPAAPPTQRAAVQGTVIAPDGVPAENIALIITNAEGIDRRVVTGPNGAYIFGGLQPGNYRLRIEDAGPNARPFPATELAFAPGERRQFDVRLQPLPPPPPPVVAPAEKPAVAPAAPQGRVATLPVAKPEKRGDGDFTYPVPEVTAPGGEFEAMSSRWDFKFPPYQRYEHNSRMPWVIGGPLDPYNQNTAKGDRPIFGSQTLFANLNLQANSTINPRQVFDEGAKDQVFDIHNLVGGLEIFRGDTVFQPKRWAARATVVANLNQTHTDADTTTRKTYGVEEAFVEKRLAVLGPSFDFISARAGMQNFNSDFRGYLFVDNQLGVRLFGNAGSNRFQYNVAYFDMRERESFSQLHTFTSRQQRVIIANYYIADFGAPGYTALFNVHVNSDRKDLEPGTDPQQVTYLGFHGDGRWGSWAINHAFYQAFGTERGNAITERLNRPQQMSINAQMAALEVSRDANWLRYRVSFYYASGDDLGDSATAKGFDTITDNPNLAGGQFMFWTQQAFFTTLGGATPGKQVLSEKFSLLPNLRTKFGQRSNFVNPGLVLVNGGVDMRLSPALKLVTNVSMLRFADATTLRALTAGQPGFEDGTIGLDIGVGAKYRPFTNENMFVVLGYATLLPGGGFKTAIGSDSRLHSFVGAIQFAY